MKYALFATVLALATIAFALDGQSGSPYYSWSKTLNPKSPYYKWEEGGVVASSDGVEDSKAIDPGVFLDPTSLSEVRK